MPAPAGFLLSTRSLGSRNQGVTAITADLLVLTPWVIFGGALAVICYRLVSRHRSRHRHDRDGR